MLRKESAVSGGYELGSATTSLRQFGLGTAERSFS